MLKEKLKRIKIFLTDVDGVLTDGKIIIDNNGVESKAFNVKDGHGLKMLIRYGIKVGFVTGRISEVVNFRAKEIGVDIVYQRALNKIEVVDEILKQYNFTYENLAYCGDDIVDIPVMKKAGISFTVNDAVDECKKIADFVTEKKGGDGAVREITDMILKAQGFWEEVKDKYNL